MCNWLWLCYDMVKKMHFVINVIGEVMLTRAVIETPPKSGKWKFSHDPRVHFLPHIGLSKDQIEFLAKAFQYVNVHKILRKIINENSLKLFQVLFYLVYYTGATFCTSKQTVGFTIYQITWRLICKNGWQKTTTIWSDSRQQKIAHIKCILLNQRKLLQIFWNF